MTTLWSHTTSAHDALGHRFGVRCNDAAVGGHLGEVLAPLRSPGAVDDWYDVLVDSDATQVWSAGKIAWGGHISVLVPALHGLINRAAVDAAGVIALHASAGSFGGATAVFPAPTESGKSTLIASLVLAGWSYLTDEVAAVDPSTGQVRPYRKAISIDRGSWGVLPELEPTIAPALAAVRGDQWQVPVAPADTPTEPVNLIAFPKYEAGATTILEEMSGAQTVLELGMSSFNLQALGADGLEQLAAIARRSHCYRLTIGDRASACDALGELTSSLFSGMVTSA